MMGDNIPFRNGPTWWRMSANESSTGVVDIDNF